MEGLRTAYATITKFLVLALMPAGVGLIVLSRQILEVFYMQIGHDAVLTELTISSVVACTVIITFGLFAEAMISVALNVLMVYENYRVVLIARMASLLSIPLLLLLVPQFGAVGAAVAASAAGLSSRLIALVYATRRLELVFPGRFFARVGAASALMGFVLLLPATLLPGNLIVSLALVALGIAIFLGVFKAMGGMDEADKERLRSMKIPFAGVALRLL